VKNEITQCAHSLKLVNTICCHDLKKFWCCVLYHLIMPCHHFVDDEYDAEMLCALLETNDTDLDEGNKN